jgi:hypothetical protein
MRVEGGHAVWVAQDTQLGHELLLARLFFA